MAVSSVSADTTAVDTSCRWPVLTLLKGAAFWLVVSSAFGLVASLKFHKPEMFSGCAWLSYGRAYAVWADALVYGFCVPVALAAGLWILARLGRVNLHLSMLATAGGKLWHLGVFFGLIGILRGNTTGYEWFELPRYATLMLLGSFLMIAVSAFVTHANRIERELQPAQWFTLASLFWFPWIFSTAMMLLQFFPVRGLAQAAVAWWFSGNLLIVWLTLSGLGITFYLLPKLAQRPLQSSYTALFAFWTLILFGSFTGIPGGAALPAWMPALSGGASLMLVVTALGLMTCLFGTMNGSPNRKLFGPFCYTRMGGMCLVLSLLLLAATGIPQVSRVTDFTWYGHGQTLLRLYGFFALTAFAAVYHILPRVTGRDVCARGVSLHYWLAMPGALLMSLPLVIGGVIQGLNWLRPDVEFLAAAKRGLMALRLATLGEILFALGSLLFCSIVVGAVFKTCRATVVAACVDEPKISGAEVRA